jgi:CBS domain containing-hemolysin-like protein
MTLFFYLLAIGWLTYYSAYISASETALFSLPSPKLKAFRSDKNPTKRLIAKLLSKSRDLLVTIFMVNTFTNIALQNVTSSLFGPASSWVLRVGVPLIITLILGEIVPKYYGMQNNVSYSLKVAPSIDRLHRWLRPLRTFVVKVTVPVSRALFFFLKRDESLSRDELIHVVKTSAEKGILKPDEKLLVTGYLDLQDIEVKEIMRPRNEMITYDISHPLSKLQHLFSDQKITRIPVIDKSIDTLLGIIDAYTFFIHAPEINEAKDLVRFLKHPRFIPETAFAKGILRKIQKEEDELLIVVDEYGAITGLVTKEDLLEVVVGQIEDSRDTQADYIASSKNEIIANGNMEIMAFNALFDVDLTSENNRVSLGGWLTEKLGVIPKAGTEYEGEGFLFKVLSSSEVKIDKIYVRRLTHG